jgi:CheY-like chemotaxis protein
VARTALAHLLLLLPDLGRTDSTERQQDILRSIAETARGLSAAAAASGLPAMAAAAEGTDHFARRLSNEEEPVTPSQCRTLRQAVSCLQALTARQPHPTHAAWTPGLTLIVDDVGLAARFANTALAKARIPTMTALDPHAALQLLDAQDFGLVVSDVRMAGMDGDAFALAVRAHRRHASVPIIFVTSCTDFTCRLPDGTECDVITKPYRMAELAVKALMHLTAATGRPGSDEAETSTHRATPAGGDAASSPDGHLR